jgi:hypothetical protein
MRLGARTARVIARTWPFSEEERMTENDLVELSRLFPLWLFALSGESPLREVLKQTQHRSSWCSIDGEHHSTTVS